MDKVCAAAILSIFEAAYPAVYAKQRNESKLQTINLMEQILAEYDNELSQLAAVKWVADDSPFPPSPGQLLSVCEELKQSVSMISIFGAEVAGREKLPQLNEYLRRMANGERKEAQMQAKQRRKLSSDNFKATPRDLDFLVE